ncbi:KRI1-like family-domain-containing protein [Butyriboletus roseoflavus]|nr:KRI1-like family-domain-containing protein [Butyriboletus roseoflavus]
MISDSDSETNDLHTLTINEHFAKAFEYKKEREELAKLKEKYGSDYSGSGPSDDDSEDSEDTEEDSDGGELTPAVDAAILRTLVRIKKKDPAIYEGGRRVFEEEHTRTQDNAPATKPKAKEKSTKPLTIRDAALASVLAEADSHSRSPSPEPHPLTHTEEQALLRSETRAAFHGAVGSEAQGDDDDLLIPRSRTRDEIELEEEEYKAFLEREVGEDLHNLVTVGTNEVVGASEDVELVGDGDKKHEGTKKKKGKKEREKEKERTQENDGAQAKKATKKRDKRPKEEVDHEFLMNYIFNRGWVDKSNRRVPTYNEIVESSSKSSKRGSTKIQADSDGSDGIDRSSVNEKGEAQGTTLSDEDAFDDLADAFETSYNFRFEEPGGALVASFPRDVSSARREATTRKDARGRKKERQEAEKHALLEARRAEIRRERALVEAAVAEQYPDDEDTSNQKKSKKQQRKEELVRLKALKANELRRKLEKVSSEGGLGGISDEAVAHLDLDADWDPSKHDAQIAELYCGDDGIVDDGDAEKPTWDDDIDIDDIVPPTNTKSKAELKKQKKKETKKNKKADEDVGVDVDEMDADLDAGADRNDWDDDGEEWKGTEEERKRKVDAYMDEVVNRLGFSGIVSLSRLQTDRIHMQTPQTSHMPTRFHYISTVPEDYGLTPTEILLATDAELNSYVGLKKMAPYRVDRDGKAKKHWDPKRADRLKEFRENLHSRVGSRYEGSWSLDVGTNTKNRATEAQGEKKKRKGKKERAKLKATQGENDDEGDEGNDTGVQSEKRKRDPETNSHFHAALSGETEKDVEDGARRKRRRHRKRSGADALLVTNSK